MARFGHPILDGVLQDLRAEAEHAAEQQAQVADAMHAALVEASRPPAESLGAWAARMQATALAHATLAAHSVPDAILRSMPTGGNVRSGR